MVGKRFYENQKVFKQLVTMGSTDVFRQVIIKDVLPEPHRKMFEMKVGNGK